MEASIPLKRSSSSLLDGDSKRQKLHSSTAVEATSSPLKRSSSSLLDAYSKRQKLHSSTAVEATSSSLLSLLHSGPILHPIRLEQSPAARCPSNLTNTTFHHLPCAVLLEVLCRLPSYKDVCTMKFVCKRWYTLISDHYCFLPFQGGSNQMVRTLINSMGEEFLTRMSSERKVLDPLFQKLMKFHSLKKEPIVVATYSDLVLCCESLVNQRDYYICNPRTYQWVSLPPPPHICLSTSVGFICDLPHCQRKEGDYNQKEDKHILFNSEFRGRVVRIISSCSPEPVFKLKVQIFSTEIGEWTESIVSIPSSIPGDDINPRVSRPYNGVLYWMSRNSDFLIGLDPFKITDSKSTSLGNTSGDDTIDEYKCRFIKIVHPVVVYNFRFPHKTKKKMLQFLGEHRGCLQLCYSDNTEIVSVWELNEEDIFMEEEDTREGVREFHLQDRGVELKLESRMIPVVGEHLEPLGFDPNSDGSLYMERGMPLRVQRKGQTVRSDIFMYNKRTEMWSKIAERIPSLRSTLYYQVSLPCWPTPVPRQQHSSITFPVSSSKTKLSSLQVVYAGVENKQVEIMPRSVLVDDTTSYDFDLMIVGEDDHEV